MSMDSMSWFPPIPFHTLSTALSHLIPPRPFVKFSHTALLATAGNLLLACSLLCIVISTSSRLLFDSSGYITRSSLHTVLLVVFQHPSTFFSCCHPYRFQLFYGLGSLPILLLHKYSCGTTRFIRTHILILVSRCESGRIASILPTCALPFTITFAVCASESSLLRSPRQGMYIGLRSVIHPTSTRMFGQHIARKVKKCGPSEE